MTRHYIGQTRTAAGRVRFTSRPYLTRTAAAHAAFKGDPKAIICCTGYGHAGSFDMRWHERREPEFVERRHRPMTLQDMTDTQLARLYRRLYAKITKDHFGADWRTLQLTAPGLSAAAAKVLTETQRRQVQR